MERYRARAECEVAIVKQNPNILLKFHSSNQFRAPSGNGRGWEGGRMEGTKERKKNAFTCLSWDLSGVLSAANTAWIQLLHTRSRISPTYVRKEPVLNALEKGNSRSDCVFRGLIYSPHISVAKPFSITSNIFPKK